ncbi:MAG: hypothetical protein Q8R28_22205, partial [Dehalococcoidia bacterium]|nr:hypothetical protein [Dehalococcoidia bacterium]
MRRIQDGALDIGHERVARVREGRPERQPALGQLEGGVVAPREELVDEVTVGEEHPRSWVRGE